MARSVSWKLRRAHRRAWRGYAVEFIKIFAESFKGELFTAADLIKVAVQQGFKLPNDVREWGPALQDAYEAGYIMHCGKVTSPNPARKYAKTALWYAKA